jgi:hypothetical protein
MTRWVWLVVNALLCVALNTGAAHAQCAGTPTPLQARESSAFIFSGVVTEITIGAALGTKVTFEVDGVWKGSLTRTAVFYAFLHSESLPLAKGIRYLIFARPAREYLELARSRGIDPLYVVGIGGCGDSARYDDAIGRPYLTDLGPGRRPN